LSCIRLQLVRGEISYRFWEKEQTQAEVEVFILDELYKALPTPPFTRAEKEDAARKVYEHVWQRALAGSGTAVSVAASF
jgi:hypothetical protein